MARRKIPEHETEVEQSDRRIRDTISNTADRSAKTSWNRKMDNMVKLMAKVRPIENEIIALQAEKQPIFDEIQELRKLMVKECVHPYEYLLVVTDEENDYTLCKFCERKLVLPNGNSEES